MKKIQLFTLITGVVMLSGCSAFQKHHGINWGNGSCPALAANQIQNGTLKIEDGRTLKCQIRPYVSNMACQGITDRTNADGVVCQNGMGDTALFIFDEKGVLKNHRL
ncbi:MULTISPECIES: hypothetical protein [Cronobacter]|uniref:Lipoprotein n=1 Tax=Cronobacter sakazakii (strain ATCC BAA-894) TaxID=290339 RepID=A7MGJ2_CROS8|nr:MULTISPECIES: hypothetical protein [Cronobacter]NCI18441.1 hypothetical protein [Cronobacter muytjensii]ABU76883.1 hypothetical protein ESA_01629 [Cronobacter sakazakii ATCC BAA-894]EGT4953226.1 hypothetical protein [Cronobacter sakazakii]EGZ6857439.1 hypothetical protein [Cronobacter sakazakii]EGZ6866165.1 hypothetical protein [Cronobacter sakazakii]